MFVSAYYQRLPLLCFSACLVILSLVSLAWSRFSLRHLTFGLRLNRTICFPGDEVELSLEISNKKIIPLPWLFVEEEIPLKLAKGAGAAALASPFSTDRLRWATSISGRQRIKWKHTLQCKARGEYTLGPVRMRSGDPFGLFPKELLLPNFESLLVYPKLVPVEKISIPLFNLAGERDAARRIHKDLSRTIGTRPYLRSDPFKRIHWKATARNGRLRSRQYESTTSLSILLALDTQGFCSPELSEYFELAVSVTASLAHMALKEKFPVGLTANSIPEIQIPTSMSPSQLHLILGALARVTAEGSASGDPFDGGSRHIPSGTTLVAITHRPSPSTLGSIRKLQRQGIATLLLKVGDKKSEGDLQGIATISIASPGDLYRNSIGAEFH